MIGLRLYFPMMKFPFAALACAIFLFLEGPLAACQICFPYPKKSAADYLIEGEAVVLAREDPQRPFHYRPVRVLKGDPGTKEIDLFINSVTRRTLAVFPKHAMVLVRTDEDGPSAWRSVGMANSDFGPLVSKILACAPAWEKAPNERTAFFSTHLGHPDPHISDLAHLEVARAPYAMIRTLGGVISREKIHAYLKNIRYMDWHALYILLLAQSEDVRDREFISESFRSAVRFGSTSQLAAWATAFIELEGTSAIEFIETEYFHGGRHKAKELQEILKALSVHGTHGSPALRDRIVASYETVVTLSPSLTSQITDDLIKWKRTEYAEDIGKFVADNPLTFDLPTTLRLRAYARRAPTK
jgi:hypothetical protein